MSTELILLGIAVALLGVCAYYLEKIKEAAETLAAIEKKRHFGD